MTLPAIPFSPPDITEADIQAVSSVLMSGWITSGPVVQEFEKQLASYCGTADAVALNSCTAALELALRSLNIGKGDDVLVPAYTYTASAAVVHHVGANIILVDSAPGSITPQISDYLDALTRDTKAIIVVDLAGAPFASKELGHALDQVAFIPESNVQEALGRPAVIADSAHSLGAKLGQERAGQMADLTAFSFHAVKNLTTAEGGALTWRTDLPVDHQALGARLRRLALHGQDKDARAKNQLGSWEYDVLELGYKFNMPDTLAALGLSQLRRYDGSVQRRHELLARYASHDCSISFLQHANANMKSSAHLCITQIPESLTHRRNEIIRDLGDAGIAANVHYKPLPLLTAYRKLGFEIADFPNALAYYEREITLPLYSTLSDRNVDYIMENYARSMSTR